MNDVNLLFENWFKKEYEWEMKRGVKLLAKAGDQYLQERTQLQFKSFKAALEISGVINNE